MKKIILNQLRLLFVLLACICEVQNVYAYETTIEGVKFYSDTIINGIAYNLQNATASVANSGNYEGIVEIPSLIIVDGREYRVTSIQFNAFYKSKATEIILPEELEYIGAGAFQNSEALERIVIPKSVRYIGNLAFMNCIYNHRTTKTNQKYPSVNL